MSYIDSIKNIRKNIGNKTSQIQAKPGVYRWWFKSSIAKTIIAKLGNVYDIKNLQHKNIEGEDYVALYFGIAGGKTGLLGRVKWHISQHHTVSAAESGFLSTLRQTLCAIGGYNMSDSKGEAWVNKIMDDNCWWEWDYTQNDKIAEDMETSELSSRLYPLNIEKNVLADKNAMKTLKELREKYRK